MARIVKDYLKTKTDSTYWDYIIDTIDENRFKLHNIMNVPPSNVMPPLDKPQIYYKMLNKVSSIVRLSVHVDMFDEERCFGRFIPHNFNFIEFNSRHIFVIFTQLPENALKYRVPENVLLVTKSKGSDDETIENLAHMQELRDRDNCRIGVWYDTPESPLIFTDYDILFVGHNAYYKNPDLLSWIPEHPNTHYSPKAIRNNKWDKVEGTRLNIFRCF